MGFAITRKISMFGYLFVKAYYVRALAASISVWSPCTEYEIMNSSTLIHHNNIDQGINFENSYMTYSCMILTLLWSCLLIVFLLLVYLVVLEQVSRPNWCFRDFDDGRSIFLFFCGSVFWLAFLDVGVAALCFFMILKVHHVVCRGMYRTISSRW